MANDGSVSRLRAGQKRGATFEIGRGLTSLRGMKAGLSVYQRNGHGKFADGELCPRGRSELLPGAGHLELASTFGTCVCRFVVDKRRQGAL
jgi:hypothetical protein